jgi:RNA ligase
MLTYNDFETQLEHKLVKAQIDEKRTQFKYTDLCEYTNQWNKTTENARGIIFDNETKQLVAMPFPKFHNLNKYKTSMREVLPNEPFNVYEKIDGDLGIIYNHNNKFNVSTRFAINNKKSENAKQILDAKYNR